MPAPTNYPSPPQHQATFLRRFLHQAGQKKYVYYIMEAFDQPWKRISEGSVGAYWGVYDVQRHPKFAFSAPIVGIPEWRTLAAISIVIGIITFTMLLIDSKTLQNRGRSFLAIVAFFAATAADHLHLLSPVHDDLRHYCRHTHDHWDHWRFPGSAAGP